MIPVQDVGIASDGECTVAVLTLVSSLRATETFFQASRLKVTNGLHMQEPALFASPSKCRQGKETDELGNGADGDKLATGLLFRRLLAVMPHSLSFVAVNPIVLTWREPA